MHNIFKTNEFLVKDPAISPLIQGVILLIYSTYTYNSIHEKNIIKIEKSSSQKLGNKRIN